MSLSHVVYVHLSGYTGVSGQQFQIPTPQEVVHNAMFIPSGQAPTSESSSTAQPLYDFSDLIFPFMNFTCRSNIRRLIFVARLVRSDCLTLLSHNHAEIIWPQFYLWQRSMDGNQHYYHHMHSIGPLSPDHLVCIDVLDTPSPSDYQVGLIEMKLTTPSVRFEVGDILGLQQQSTLVTPTQSVSVLRQKRGYGLTLKCPLGTNECNESVQQMPYIAIETGMNM